MSIYGTEGSLSTNLEPLNSPVNKGETPSHRLEVHMHHPMRLTKRQTLSLSQGFCSNLQRTTFRQVILNAWLCVLVSVVAISNHAFKDDFQPLINSTCSACHSNEAMSLLDFTKLGHDLSDPQIYRKWERIFERLERGEMPPAPMPKPDAAVLDPAMHALRESLTEANLAKRGNQRTPLRRMTRLEYQYTIQDLLHLEPGAVEGIITVLPAEADSGGFDTVAANQGISPLHVRGYMQAAQNALDIALRVGPKPETKQFLVEYAKSGYMNFMSNAKILGSGITTVLEDGVVAYFETGSTYLFHSGTEGFDVPEDGVYQIAVDAYPVRNLHAVTMTIESGTQGAAAAASLDKVLGIYDLEAPEGRTFTVSAFLRPGDVVVPVPHVKLLEGAFGYFDPALNMKDYQGEGIVFKSLAIEGPIHTMWPPYSARALLPGIEFENNEPILTKSPNEHVRDVVAAFLPRAFRREVDSETIDRYVALAEPALAEGRGFLEAVRVPLAAILTSPAFLFQASDEQQLDDFALASRLSYFLWRSMPDDELLAVAASGGLSDPQGIQAQTERLLEDPKSDRFIKDFAGQAFRLYELHATTPDPGLYPEYDSRLAKAMAAETELFLRELIATNLSIKNLIQADFTFLNRRLAEHYGIDGIQGQQMRKVELPTDHVRGGLLAQAAIHKITANGTTTSPVPRGNFVLANVLGQPAPPPPPDVTGLEPDTRGTTTIREQLAAHRSNTVCASCHLSIDPPGFAMESFDPIGGFRERYRATGEPVVVDGDTYPGQYKLGLAVDTSGATPEGDTFSNFSEYQKLMVQHKLKYVAGHFASQLLVLATGAEVEFADRDAISAIVGQVEGNQYPLRDMIHEVVASEMFRSQ